MHAPRGSSEAGSSSPLVRDSSSAEVFLDFSGTLVHPLGDRFPVFREVLMGLGFPLELAALEGAELRVREARGNFLDHYLGKPLGFWDEYQAGIIDELSADPVPTPRAVQLLHRAFASSRWHPPYAETASVLEDLHRRGVPMHVVSNYTELLPEILGNLGWSGHFATVTYSQEAGIEKPRRGIFELALRRASCEPERATFVGDTWSADIVGAREAGLRAIWLDREGTFPHRDGPRINDLTGLVPMLIPDSSTGAGP
jgi:HAD superfamily hydrolase (TIGR01509 family)